MAYANMDELKKDVLFRAFESSASSDWNAKVIDYLNRVYRTLCAGASEFLPEYVEDWWWLRATDVLTLEPIINAGTVSVTKDNANITFSSAPSQSVAGWRIRFDGHTEVFKILTHTAAATAAVLDSPYTGATAALKKYTLMKVSYSLSAAVNAVTAPMIGFRSNPKIIGMSPERMDELYPIPELNSGIPGAFALDDVRTVRFSHGGRTDGQRMRVEYRYRPIITDLLDSVSSIPLVPLEWRHLLADMALTYVYLDKNDDRSNAVALSARTGLAGMLKENRRRLKKMGATAGHIYPRQGEMPGINRPVPRTDSGLIIG